MDGEVLRYQPRSVLRLMGTIDDVLKSHGALAEAAKCLEACEEVMREIGAVKGDDGQWSLPGGNADG